MGRKRAKDETKPITEFQVIVYWFYKDWIGWQSLVAMPSAKLTGVKVEKCFIITVYTKIQ